MKKKLAALDLRIQIGAVVFLVLLVAIGGYMFVVSPQHAQAAKLQKQIDAEQSLIYQRRAQLKKGLHPPTIETADVYRLARAMPDREDMPGIILTLSEVARQAGITFATIEPVVGGTQPGLAGPFQTRRIHLIFNGDFYGLSDFLYRSLGDSERKEVERMKATNTIWTVQIYPNTPVGFNIWHAATLDAAIDAARQGDGGQP